MSARVFLDYDQAALDAQYAHYSRVPEAPEILARHKAAAARALAEVRFTHMRYGPAPAQSIRIAPAAEGAGPLVVFFHGGGWATMEPADFAHVVPAFHAMGAHVALPGFLQRPEATLPEIVAQCRDAVAHLVRGAADLPGNGRIILAGVSSGAHLAAMCALPGWRKAAGLPLDAVAGLAGLCGMYDLEPIRLSSRNATLELDAGTARAMSPAAGDGARQAPPPAVAAYGARESEEMARQARALASGWAAAGGEVAVIAAKGRNHFDLLDDLAIPESALAQAVRGLVTRAATGSGAAP